MGVSLSRDRLAILRTQAPRNAPDITTTKACAPAPSAPRCSAVRCAGPRWRRSPMGAVRADHAAGGGRHTARGCVEAVGVVCPTSRPATKCVVVRRPVDVDRTYQDLSLDMVRNTRRISTLTPSAGHHWWYGNFAPVTEFLNTAT